VKRGLNTKSLDIVRPILLKRIELMAQETEIEIRIGSDDQILSVLALCRALYTAGEQLNQRDEYFDTRDENLRSKILL
jgi:hypothetical protein